VPKDYIPSNNEFYDDQASELSSQICRGNEVNSSGSLALESYNWNALFKVPVPQLYGNDTILETFPHQKC